MNITRKNDTVVMEMTLDEARELEKACLSAKWYWQRENQQVETQDAKAVTLRLARKYAELRSDIADIIGY